MTQYSKHLLQIHIAVLLFGLAGLFGKWLLLHPIIIVLGRVFFASLALAGFLLALRRPLHLRKKQDAVYLAVLGALLAVHWITFFQSIQVSTVAVGLLTFSTFPVFTALLEPIFFKERWRGRDLLIAGITFGGIAIVVPEFELQNDYFRGASWGILSGLSFAFLAIFNRKYVRSYSGIELAFFQDLVATVLLLPFFFWWSPSLTSFDWGALLLLGVVFTALSHSFFINGLKSVSAKTASVIGSLEPVYGIMAAALLLREFPTWQELLGGAIILSMALLVSIRP